MNQQIRVGLIGYGLWGAHHARAIDGTVHARLAAIAVPSENRRDEAARSWPDVDVFPDYRDLLARDDIDAVSVAVPNHLHHEIGLAALRSGKHLLLEKPMALRVAECDALIAEAERRRLVLAVNHEMRLSSLWGRVRSLLEEGAIGSPQYVLIELSRFPYRQGSGGWRYDIGRVGNWILEEPIHFFDLARWYFQGHGEPVSVFARASSRDPMHSELQDNFSAIIEFTGGGYALVTQSLAAFEHHVTCKVTGSRGA
ncbi:MAG: Gfo/Idh/MocA family oxidoreductase, partial [Planctomycetes bacterium]|nr:Gfo/Idh/MocA family oxidoreductase [Planctomycetota bacterium]